MRKTEFEKVMTRDASLAMVEAWNGMFESCSRVTKIKWPSPIFIFRNGAVESWRPGERFFTVLPKYLEKWLAEKRNRNKFWRALEVYKSVSRRFKRSLTIHVAGTRPALALIVSTCLAFVKGSAGLGIAHWLGAWHELDPRLDYPKSLLGFWRKLRKTDSLFDDASEIIYRLLLVISKNEKAPLQNLKLLRIKELQSRKDWSKFQERERGYFYYVGKLRKLHQLPGFLKERNFVLKKGGLVRKDYLRGNSAYPGRVKGVAKVVFNRLQSGKIKKGDVLVAPMTTPWYVPLMKKAAAFVTDEGGMMCHAAVIARELKKSCVIGTKFATKVLKDGDMVEVDANKGIVKVLKRRGKKWFGSFANSMNNISHC